MELQLYREYRDIVRQFSYVVETERRFYLANQVDLHVRNSDGEVYFEVEMHDAWVWDMYRPARFVKNVRVMTFKDVNVEERAARKRAPCRTRASPVSTPRSPASVFHMQPDYPQSTIRRCAPGASGRAWVRACFRSPCRLAALAFVVPGSAVRAFPGRAGAVPVAASAWPLDGVPAVTPRFDPPPEPWLRRQPRRRSRVPQPGGRRCVPPAPALSPSPGMVAGGARRALQHAHSTRHGLRTTYEPVEAVGGGRCGGWRRALGGALVAGHAGCPGGGLLHWGLRARGGVPDPLTCSASVRVRPVRSRNTPRSVARVAASRKRSYSSGRL
jgi:hypothetical protein